jgi:hypothetical protein
MERGKTLKENISWLLQQYKKELKIEEEQDIEEQNFDIIESYKNIIIELEYALSISK